MKTTLLLIALFASLSGFAQAQNFHCTTEDQEFGGWLAFEAELQGSLIITGKSYEIIQYDFTYDAKDGENSWSKADIRGAGPVLNNPNYRPRVYFNHLQFDISEGVFDYVNMLLPQKALTHNSSVFKVVLIMSWIEDHAGGTVFLDCRWI